MAIVQAMCNSYKQEAMKGIHLEADVYKIALFTSAANLSKATTVYDPTNEVADSGDYAAGGQVLATTNVGLDGDVAFIDWSTDPVWTGATITARGALIYNSSRANKAVAVIDFGVDKISTNGTFTLVLPAAVAATALIRFA